MTLPLALVCLGVLGFVGFVLWLRAQRPAQPDPRMQTVTANVAEIVVRLVKAEETLSTHSLALGLGHGKEKRA